MKALEEFQVDTRLTKAVVVESLTRDASIEACIFDLIDNSIDAAHETINRTTGDAAILPENYRVFSIDLAVSGTTISVEDNCGGITADDLRTSVLRFGQQSSHDMGIGVFGVGLNRALFKLGRKNRLETDTGDERCELDLDVAEYLSHPDDWDLPAQRYPSLNTPGTSIYIGEIPADISQTIADEDWRKRFREELAKRYGRFIAKGLALKLNGKAIPASEAAVRSDGPVDGEYKFFRTEKGVSIHVQYGQHSLHRFTNEEGYDRDANSALTGEFGWTVYCNDRAIIIADQTWKSGWDGKFHSEFYGFVGIVRFVSVEPNNLPWNTAKTDVDLNNEAYQAALVDMKKFAEKWRSFADQRKKGRVRGEVLRPIPPRKVAETPRKPISPPTPKPPAGPVLKPVVKHDHNQTRMLLPKDVDERHCFDKHLALVHEAKDLDLADFTYSGLALLRMLFEASVVTHMDRHKHGDQLRAAALAKRRQRVPVSPAEEKEFLPKMDEMLAFLQSNLSTWAPDKGRFLKHSLARMISYMPKLNGVMHNPYQPINKTMAFQVRDEVLPVLRYLIET